jgi:NADH dehydrogenase (ubiquinone) 1 alpha subcomplex subunit 9
MTSFPLGIPLANGGQQKLRPVYVGDVAAILSSLLKNDNTQGKQLIELYGPKEYYYHRLIQLFLDTTKRDVSLVHLPKPIFK